MRYSHVGVIVSPANRALGSGSHGPIMLEAVDNKDINCPDQAGVVRHDCVQMVDVCQRAFGKDGDRLCYHRLAVRHLNGFEWTPDRRRRLAEFASRMEGRPLDKDALSVSLRFLHPLLYQLFGKPRQSSEVSCSELIAELYKSIGVTTDGGLPSERVAPFHFAGGMEKSCLRFTKGVSLGPEIRIVMEQPLVLYNR